MAITRPTFWRGFPFMQFFLVEDIDQMWSWQLKSGGDIVAVSPAAYASAEAALLAVAEIKNGIGAAQLPDDGYQAKPPQDPSSRPGSAQHLGE